MRNQRIIDRVALLIFLPKRRVHPSDPHIEHTLPPKARNIFEVEVTLAQMCEHIALLTRRKIDFAKEINVIPDRGLHEQLRFIEPKFRMGKHSLRTGLEKTHRSLGADADLAQGRAD